MQKVYNLFTILVILILCFVCLSQEQKIYRNLEYIDNLQTCVIQLQEDKLKSFTLYDASYIPKSRLGQISYTKLAGE